MTSATVAGDSARGVPSVTLSDGVQMPMLGFGTSGVSLEEMRASGEPLAANVQDPAYEAIKHALRCGYRFFDTAALYLNEDTVGRALSDAISEGLVKRSELFVCTKVWCTAHKRRSVTRACRESLAKLRLEYVDLYLIHWPMAYLDRFEEDDASRRLSADELSQVQDRLINPRHPKTGKLLYSDTHFLEAWQGMEDVKEAGLARSVGVSNFTARMMEEIFAMPTLRHRPTVNQIEMHPYLAHERLLQFARQHQVLLNAYCPLGAPGASWCPAGYPKLMDDPLISELARKHSRTSAQVILRFHLQRGVAPIPKSVTAARIEANIKVFDFELAAEELEALLRLDCNRRYCQSTANERVHDHRLFPNFDADYY